MNKNEFFVTKIIVGIIITFYNKYKYEILSKHTSWGLVDGFN